MVSTHFPIPVPQPKRVLELTRLYGLVAGEALARSMTEQSETLVEGHRGGDPAWPEPSSTLPRTTVLELTDTIVRSLLAAGLSLAEAQSLLGEGAAGDRVAAAIDEVDRVLGGVRSAVLELHGLDTTRAEPGRGRRTTSSAAGPGFLFGTRMCGLAMQRVQSLSDIEEAQRVVPTPHHRRHPVRVLIRLGVIDHADGAVATAPSQPAGVAPIWEDKNRRLGERRVQQGFVCPAGCRGNCQRSGCGAPGIRCDHRVASPRVPAEEWRR
jgi:hypothetical protein